MKKLKLQFSNTDDKNATKNEIVVDYIAIVITYDADILVDGGTKLYTINSYFDLDFRKGYTLSDESVPQELNSTNYLFNYNPRHNRLKALNKSFLWLCSVTVDLTETGGRIPNRGNPPFVGDASSKIQLLRWLKIRARDNASVPVENASVKIAYERNKTPVSPAPEIILDYFNKNLTNWNLTDALGKALIPLCSDLLTPGAWPNSEFVGNYTITADYKDVFNNTIVSLSKFPDLTENSNFEEHWIRFSELLLPPTSIDDKLTIVTISNEYCNPNDKITISGVVKYNNKRPVANARVEVSIDGRTFYNTTSEEGDFRVEITAPGTAQSYPIHITIYERRYNLTPYATSRMLVVAEAPSLPNILLLIVILVVVVACFSTLLLRHRLKLLFYIAKARIKKEKFIECSECGYSIPISARKCPKCKASFEEEVAKCSECGAIIPADSKKCPTCGAVFERERSR